MNEGARNRLSKQMRITLFLVMAVAGGVSGYFVYRWNEQRKAQPGEEGPEVVQNDVVPPLTADEARAAIELKDVSIGHLENGPAEVEAGGRKAPGMEVAAEGFERLAEQLPGEILPFQDLTITRLLQLRAAQEGIPQYREVARQAANRFIKAHPEEAVAYYLAAQIELFPDPANPMSLTANDRKRAIDLLKQATDREGENAVFWFAVKEAATKRDDTEPSALAKSALQRAYALDKRNLFLITELLLMQAETEDPEIVQTLEDAKTVLRPLVPAVKQRARLDLIERVDSVVEAAKAEQWRNVLIGVRMLTNVVRPEEVAKSDITRVDVHPLAYLLYDFSPEFFDRYGHPEPSWDKSTSVTLKQVADDTLRGLTEVRDLCLMDFTLDGHPDLLVLQPGKLSLFSRDSLGQPWTLLTELDVAPDAAAVLAADLDRDSRKSPLPPSAEAADDETGRFDKVVSPDESCHDADPDIVLYGPSGVTVLRNDLNAAGDAPKLVEVENPGLAALRGVRTGILVDVDHDGDLDLIFSADGGLTIWQAGAAFEFSDRTEFSRMPPPDPPVSSLVAVDWDRDTDIDVMLGEPSGGAAGYLENLRHGEFRWRPLGDQFGQLGHARKIALLESDGNVSWDLLAAGQQGVHLLRTATPRSGVVNFLAESEVSPDEATGVLTWDFDNDGFQDAAVWNEAGLSVWRGGPQGSFAAAPIIEQRPGGAVRVARAADLDRDGDQDLVCATTAGIVLLVNEGGTDNSWITVYPMGQSDNKGRCNHHAIGSLVELRAGGWYQAQVVDASTVHFGLGDQQVAQQLRVVWTNGVPQDIVNQAGNVAICEPMVLKGSCPYLYTWADGEFSFLTDCLWAAPLGLQTSEGTVMPTRSWEYLLIPGQRLSPHRGSYWLMLTEELWEAGYFDKVQLIAIDHPADVEVYSNEKVGPGAIAEFKIHTVSERRRPVRATDQNGHDLRAQLRRRDGDFVKAFDRRLRQGLTTEHYVEFDLGPLEDPQQITLFLTGWIMPTDTSLNVAFAQDPETDGPRLPSVWVPDADGQFREAVAYMGFPGGKTKTIAVDLSDAFLTDDYRVRIKTTAEIYWDEAFFTLDEPKVDLHQIPLTLESAELAYRGVSAGIPRTDEEPQMYDFHHVRTAPAWPPMRGKFTRYGPVTELVDEADDLLAVLGSGDAMTVRFAVPDQELPAGWKRDFVLHSIGYDKDADLNTIYGHTVGPLPYRAMKSYPFGPNDAPPSGAEYETYLQTYQTREQDPRLFWRNLGTIDQ